MCIYLAVDFRVIFSFVFLFDYIGIFSLFFLFSCYWTNGGCCLRLTHSPTTTTTMMTTWKLWLAIALVACSTTTVTKCQAGLRTLQAFPVFHPTCLCREPSVDPDCNAFRDSLFDHPCMVSSQKGTRHYATCLYLTYAGWTLIDWNRSLYLFLFVWLIDWYISVDLCRVFIYLKKKE